MDMQMIADQVRSVVNGQTMTAVGALAALAGGGWGLWKAGAAGISLIKSKVEAPYVMALVAAAMIGEGVSQMAGYTHHGPTVLCEGAVLGVCAIILGTSRAEKAEKDAKQKQA